MTNYLLESATGTRINNTHDNNITAVCTFIIYIYNRTWLYTHGRTRLPPYIGIYRLRIKYIVPPPRHRIVHHYRTVYIYTCTHYKHNVFKTHADRNEVYYRVIIKNRKK